MNTFAQARTVDEGDDEALPVDYTLQSKHLLNDADTTVCDAIETFVQCTDHLVRLDGFPGDTIHVVGPLKSLIAACTARGARVLVLTVLHRWALIRRSRNFSLFFPFMQRLKWSSMRRVTLPRLR